MIKLKTLTLIAAAAISLTSCKKESQPSGNENTNIKPLKDSVSFTINSNQYIFDGKNAAGIGNYAVNVKPYTDVKSTGKLAYETGGYYWYGAADSTLYSVFFDMNPVKPGNTFKISFNKKFKDSALQKGQILLKLKSSLVLFEPGELPFAVDLEKENTLEGISIDVAGEGINGEVSTRIPGFSILVRSDLDTHIQDDSSFEITNLIQLSNNLYIVEAKFEANLYNQDEERYRLTNGFLRIRVNMLNPDDIDTF